jgi:hypothetical protein
MDPESAAAARLAALDAATAALGTIAKAVGDGIDATWVAAIGIEETQFGLYKNTSNNIFQILPSNATAAQAANLSSASSIVAQLLLANISSLAGFHGLTGQALEVAVFDAYNAGAGGGETGDRCGRNG